MTAALIELHTFPNTAFFRLFRSHDPIIIEACENYNKRSFRNRFEIFAANGRTTLSLPLKKGKNNAMPIQQVELVQDNHWSKSQWQTIRSAYGKSPFFEHYEAVIKSLVLQPEIKLFDNNLKVLNTLIELLGLSCTLERSKSYVSAVHDQGIADYRNQYNPNASYLIETAQYPQVFQDKHGYQSNLSILDLLFNMGPAAATFL